MTKTINDDLLTLEEIKVLLQDRRLYRVAKLTGLTYPTVKKFCDGKAEKCTYTSLRAMSSYLKPYADDSKLPKKLKPKIPFRERNPNLKK